MKCESIDIFMVDERHAVIHYRLENWARWVKPGIRGWPEASLWRMGKSNARQWHSPILNPTVDQLDGARMESAVRQLPQKNRDAIRWWYVYRYDAMKARRRLGQTLDGLMLLVRDGRTMLDNRL